MTPTDYDHYCITTPLDSRLPDGGGYQICGLYNIKPAFQGLVKNFVTSSEPFGDLGSLYRGFDLTGSARLPRGRVSGRGQLRTDVEQLVLRHRFASEPALLRRGDPYLPNIRFSGSYQLPWGITTGVVYANLPGPEITASYQATNAEIRPSLGRNVSAGANALTTVPLLEGGTLYGARQQQLDIRLGKRILAGKTRIDGVHRHPEPAELRQHANP